MCIFVVPAIIVNTSRLVAGPHFHCYSCDVISLFVRVVNGVNVEK